MKTWDDDLNIRKAGSGLESENPRGWTGEAPMDESDVLYVALRLPQAHWVFAVARCADMAMGDAPRNGVVRCNVPWSRL